MNLFLNYLNSIIYNHSKEINLLMQRIRIKNLKLEKETVIVKVIEKIKIIIY